MVKPELIAFIASSLMWSGVSKSGSPELKLMIFSPALYISLAFCEILTVRDCLNLERRLAINDIKRNNLKLQLVDYILTLTKENYIFKKF